MVKKITRSEREYKLLELATLQEIGKVIISTQGVDSVLIEILKALAKLLNFEYSTISLVDKRTNTISTKHGIWENEVDTFPEWLQLSSYSLEDKDIQADIVLKGKYEVIDKWDDRFNKQIWDKFNHEQLIRVYMPINIKGQTIGTIEAGYKKRNRPTIDKDQIQLLEAFANQAAIAIENAAQFESIKLMQQHAATAEKLSILRSIADQLAHRINNAAGTIPSMARDAKRTLSDGSLDSSNPVVLS